MKTTFFVKDLTVKYKFLKYRGDLGFPSDNHEHRYLLVMLLQDQVCEIYYNLFSWPV